MSSSDRAAPRRLGCWPAAGARRPATCGRSTAAEDGREVVPDLAAIEVDPALRPARPVPARLPARRVQPARACRCRAAYRLDIVLRQESNTLAIQLDNTPTRVNLSWVPSFTLTRIADGAVLYDSAIRRVVSYNIRSDPFATLIAEQDAERRAAREVARQIRTILSLYFAEPGRVKLKAQAVEGFLARPDPRIATVLLYGPDAGLVAERARRLAGRSSTTCGDPFRVSELAGDELRAAPAGWSRRRRPCACWAGAGWCGCATPPTSSPSPCATCWPCRPRKASWCWRPATSAAAPACASWSRPPPRPRRCPATATRGAISAASCARCWPSTGSRAAPDAVAYLESHLGGDRGVTRAEIAKLALYLADRPGPAGGARGRRRRGRRQLGAGPRRCGPRRRARPPRGAGARARPAAGRGRGARPAAPRRRRTCSCALLRLQRRSVPARRSTAVVAGARPPIFFRQRPVFAEALRRWSPEPCWPALALLQAAEIRCKSAGAPEALLCRAALAQLGAALAAPARRASG